MEKTSDKKFLEKMRDFLYRAEDAVLLGLLMLMILTAAAQILLRNLFGSGLAWGDMLVRMLVLWIGLAGAMIASRNGSHIRIDLITRWLPEHLRKILNATVEFFTAVICSAVAWHSIRFIRMEYSDGGMAFASIPVWVCEAVIPFAFIVISIRYYILSFISFHNCRSMVRNG
ncbi:MAG: TRAP transporter small permease [Desulfococcaceae bacterium]